MSSSLIRQPAETRRVSIASPDAIFAPDARLDGPVPAPLYLLEFVAGTMKRDYEQTPHGTIAREEDSHQRRVIAYPDGTRLEVHVQGSQEVGLPTQFDKDYLLGLFRLAAEGRVDAEGRFIDPSYREILRASGRPDVAGKQHFDAVKRALARFGSLKLKTNADIDYSEVAAAVREGASAPVVPEGRPKRRTTQGTHWVLEYSVTTEDRGNGQTREIINLLQINPIWLAHIGAGVTTWIDVDVHNGLSSEWAKRIYQVLAVRAVRGWRAQSPHIVSLDAFLEELGVDSGRERGKLAENIQRAFVALADAGVVGECSVARVGRGRYEVTIYPGDRLLLAGLLRGVPADVPAATQMLLAHMRAYGISVEQGREFLAARPNYARTVLAFAHYLQTEKKGFHGSKRVENWNAWVYRALAAGDYGLDDPGFAAWFDRQTVQVLSGAPSAAVPSIAVPRHARRVGARRPVVSLPAPAESVQEEQAPAAEVVLPDDLWGRALAAIRPEVEPPFVFRTYLASCTLDSVDGDAVRVRAVDDFHAEKVARSWGERLRGLVSAELGRPSALYVGNFRCGGAESDAVDATSSPLEDGREE